jgi:hypothetical protein
MDYAHSDFAIYKRYRIPRPALRRIALQLRLNFDTLYKSLNGTIPMSLEVITKLHNYSGIPEAYLRDGDVDVINDYIYNRVYNKPQTNLDDVL